MIGFFRDQDPYPELGYWSASRSGAAASPPRRPRPWLRFADHDWKKRAVIAGHFADNPASGVVLCKAGFLYTGEVRRRFSRARGAEAETRMMIWRP